jgi:xanthine dehydrogenase YagS FAD-binding subunit
MQPFEYVSPPTLEAATGLLGTTWGQTEILAGGTDLLALMKDDVVTPSRLVNIKKFAGLSDVAVDGQGLHVGVLVTLDRLAKDAAVQGQYPVLATALADAASPQIRNMATLGGNLCQRPRCWYFRNGYGLLATDAAGHSLVRGGDNRYHAVLGNTGTALFVSPSTIAPVLIALGANVTIQGPTGARTTALEQFYRTPQSAQEREHDLQPQEIVTHVHIPPAGISSGAYYEVRQKHAFDWPVATATVVLAMSNGKVDRASVVLGHVAPTPWRASEAEDALRGQKIDAALAEAASRAAVKTATSLGQNGYKITVARVCVKRAILRAAGFEVPAPHPSGATA